MGIGFDFGEIINDIMECGFACYNVDSGGNVSKIDATSSTHSDSRAISLKEYSKMFGK